MMGFSSRAAVLFLRRAHVTAARCFTFGAILVALACATPALAQTPSGVMGTVSNSLGIGLPGISVELRAAAGKLVTTVSTIADGKFALAAPKDGNYYISVVAPSYQAARSATFTVGSTGIVNVDVTLASTSTASLPVIGNVSVNGASSINTSTAVISTITAKQFIDQGRIFLATLLDEQPGVTIGRVYGNVSTGPATVAIRGLGNMLGSSGGAGADEVLIEEDGEPILSGLFGVTDIAQFSRGLYSNLQVSKGLGDASVFGAPTVGGVVNFVTPNTLPSQGGELTLTYGTDNTLDTNLLQSDRFGKFSYLVDLHRYYSSGPIPRGYIGSFIYANGPPGTPFEIQSYDNQSSALFKAQYAVSPAIKVILSSTLEDDYRPNPFLAVPVLGAQGYQTTDPSNGRYLFTGIEGSFNLNTRPKFGAEVQASFAGGDLDVRSYSQLVYTLADGGTQAIPSIFCCVSQRSYDRLSGDLVSWTRTFGNQTVSLGFGANTDSFSTQVAFDTVPTTNFQTHPFGGEGTRLERTFLARDDIVFDKLTLSLAGYGSSYDTIDLHHYDPRLGAVYRPSPDSAIRFSFGTGFSPPLVSSLTEPTILAAGGGDSSPLCPQNEPLCVATGGNPNLRSETALGYDLGFDMKVAGGLRVSADSYITSVHQHDYLSLVPGPPGLTFTDGTPVLYTLEPLNVGDARFEGIELTASRPLMRSLSLSGFYDLQVANPYGVDPLTENNLQNVVNGVQLSGIPMHKISGQLNYNGPHGTSAYLQYLFTSENNPYFQPGYSIFNAGLTVPLGRSSLTLNGLNLFNNKPLLFTLQGFGVPYPGFSAPYLTNRAGLTPATFEATYEVKWGAMR
jgi:outer membrane receptor protein involved in Fe transport